MPRKELRPRERRKAQAPHFQWGSALVSRFLGKLNFQGKKNLSERILSEAFTLMKERTKEDPVVIFTRAIENAKPLLEVKPRRVGGATYQVPVAVRGDRGTTLAMRWILHFARAKEGRSMPERLADELVAASRKEGAVIKKREDTHKMAEANKAFAHYRW